MLLKHCSVRWLVWSPAEFEVLTPSNIGLWFQAYKGKAGLDDCKKVFNLLMKLKRLVEIPITFVFKIEMIAF